MQAATERRLSHAPRIAVDLPITLVSNEPHSASAETGAMETRRGADDSTLDFAQAFDLGLGGLAVQGASSPRLGTRLRCCFAASDGEIVEFDGSVVWVRDYAAQAIAGTQSSGSKAAFGLCFTGMDPHSRSAIEKMIAEHLPTDDFSIAAPLPEDSGLHRLADATTVAAAPGEFVDWLRAEVRRDEHTCTVEVPLSFLEPTQSGQVRSIALRMEPEPRLVLQIDSALMRDTASLRPIAERAAGGQAGSPAVAAPSSFDTLPDSSTLKLRAEDVSQRWRRHAHGAIHWAHGAVHRAAHWAAQGLAIGRRGFDRVAGAGVDAWWSWRRRWASHSMALRRWWAERGPLRLSLPWNSGSRRTTVPPTNFSQSLRHSQSLHPNQLPHQPRRITSALPSLHQTAKEVSSRRVVLVFLLASLFGAGVTYWSLAEPDSQRLPAQASAGRSRTEQQPAPARTVPIPAPTTKEQQPGAAVVGSGVAATGAVRSAAASTASQSFGATHVPQGQVFLLRMTEPVRGVQGRASDHGFRVLIPGSLALDGASLIAESHAGIADAHVINYGDHAVLIVDFAPGSRPLYRVVGRGSMLEITLSR